jgi:hypothetical protein
MQRWLENVSNGQRRWVSRDTTGPVDTSWTALQGDVLTSVGCTRFLEDVSRWDGRPGDQRLTGSTRGGREDGAAGDLDRCWQGPGSGGPMVGAFVASDCQPMDDAGGRSWTGSMAGLGSWF